LTADPTLDNGDDDTPLADNGLIFSAGDRGRGILSGLTLATAPAAAVAAATRRLAVLLVDTNIVDAGPGRAVAVGPDRAEEAAAPAPDRTGLKLGSAGLSLIFSFLTGGRAEAEAVDVEAAVVMPEEVEALGTVCDAARMMDALVGANRVEGLVGRETGAGARALAEVEVEVEAEICLACLGASSGGGGGGGAAAAFAAAAETFAASRLLAKAAAV
jgi:hypothetical protein